MGPPKLSAADRSPIVAIAPDGVTCQARHDVQWGGVRSTVGVAVSASSKAYFEVTVRDDGLCRVGWSSGKAALDLGTDLEVCELTSSCVRPSLASPRSSSRLVPQFGLWVGLWVRWYRPKVKQSAVHTVRRVVWSR